MNFYDEHNKVNFKKEKYLQFMAPSDEGAGAKHLRER